MASSLSNLVNNLSEGIHKIKYKYGHEDKNVKLAELNLNIANCFLEKTNLKDELTECNCLCCNKNYQQKFDENSKKRFFNT